uniref:aspartate transaminase n=1 Tax=Timema cristinae TaxID=61476 RepID=A0A7R9D3X7_TIMCR|nr:unnamed protein product [Timema cristinae]
MVAVADMPAVSTDGAPYRDENGNPWPLPVVRKVEEEIAKDMTQEYEYLWALGDKSFTSAACRLLLGGESMAIAEERVASIQSVSGTGALWMGAKYISKVLNYNTFYMSSPTWRSPIFFFFSGHFLPWPVDIPGVLDSHSPASRLFPREQGSSSMEQLLTSHLCSFHGRIPIHLVTSFITSIALLIAACKARRNINFADNHRGIFESSGLTDAREYRYWDPATRSIDMEGLLEDLRNAPKKSVIILQACSHNPTGLDPTRHQWSQIVDVLEVVNLSYHVNTCQPVSSQPASHSPNKNNFLPEFA